MYQVLYIQHGRKLQSTFFRDIVSFKLDDPNTLKRWTDYLLIMSLMIVLENIH